jgi:hypothetical protein
VDIKGGFRMVDNTVSFVDLDLKISNITKDIKIGDKHIKVKQYLPTEEKIDVATKVLNYSLDMNNFKNDIKFDIYFSLEVLYHYTNIFFSEDDKEDIQKLYDVLSQNKVFDMVINAIPEKEILKLKDYCLSISNNYYQYKNSALGIFEQIVNDYSNLELDAQKIQDEIGNPENLSLLKEIMTKLG